MRRAGELAGAAGMTGHGGPPARQPKGGNSGEPGGHACLGRGSLGLFGQCVAILDLPRGGHDARRGGGSPAWV